MVENKGFRTIPEAARLLPVAARTLSNFAREGRVPAIKSGDQWGISRTALDALSRTRGDGPAALGGAIARRSQ